MKSGVEKYFDIVAASYDSGKIKYSYYYENLKKLLKTLIPKNKKVFEIGCGTGDLLISVKPKYGYGMDISNQMIRIASAKYLKKLQIHFSTQWPKEKYDYIFMSDVIEHLENPEKTFKKISSLMNSKTIFINTMANPIWEPFLMFWEQMGWKMKEGRHKRRNFKEINSFMERAGLKVLKHDYRLLFPVRIPLITNFVNKYLEKPFKKFAFIEYIVAVRS